MKRETSRKHSAQDRINMNRFWNEMEEFYSRQQEEKTEEWRCDWEVEQAMMVLRLVDPGRQEEESDRISCYSSASSSFSGSISSSPSSPNNLFSSLASRYSGGAFASLLTFEAPRESDIEKSVLHGK